VRFSDIILHSSDWRKKSRDCIDFIRRLLIKDFNKRTSAEDALKHPWLERMRKQRIANGGSIAASGKASKKEIMDALQNLRDLKASSKLCQSVLTIIST
jgi:serine/threonine protein kinase